jgi:signal transduction histidine kinase
MDDRDDGRGTGPEAGMAAALLATTPDMVLRLDGDVVRAVNPATVRLLSAPSVEALVGRRLRDLVAEPPAGETGLLGWDRMTFRALDGTLVPVEATRVALPGAGEGETAVIARDLSVQLDVERSMRAALEAADAANDARSRFLAGIGHELRTPLNAIIGFAELIVDEAGDRSVAADYAADIRESGHHLLGIINGILDYAKIEAGRFDLTEGAVDLVQSVASVRRLLAARIAESGLTMRVEVADDLPPVIGDPIKIRQILLNLVSNAVKFTPRGGTVTVVVAHEYDGGVRVEVLDTGIGMTEAEMAIALEPFGQVANAHVRQHDGTGLGLPLARALAELHGATFTLDSRPGKGTRAAFRLPPSRLALSVG